MFTRRPAEQDGSAHVFYKPATIGYHREVARLALKYTEKGRILDIGCGSGTVLELISRSAGPEIQLVGADIDEECLRLTERRIPGVATIHLNSGPLDQERLGAGYSTCILCHVLEHLENPLQALHDVLSKTISGGHVVLATPNPARPDVMLSALLRSHYVNRGHVYAWDRSHWINFLERIAGVRVVEYSVDEVKLAPYRASEALPFFARAQRWLASAVPWWSVSNIAVVRKE